ncbi:MAG: hypothetical protein WBJ58_07625 [Syntrophales bacterium]|jgi:hypothetical protein
MRLPLWFPDRMRLAYWLGLLLGGRYRFWYSRRYGYKWLWGLERYRNDLGRGL